jgi:hypothetical protein
MHQVDNMPAREYFTYAARLMQQQPPHITDWSQVARRRLLGLVVGKAFDWDKLTPEFRRR